MPNRPKRTPAQTGHRANIGLGGLFSAADAGTPEEQPAYTQAKATQDIQRDVGSEEYPSLPEENQALTQPRFKPNTFFQRLVGNRGADQANQAIATQRGVGDVQTEQALQRESDAAQISRETAKQQALLDIDKASELAVIQKYGIKKEDNPQLFETLKNQEAPAIMQENIAKAKQAAGAANESERIRSETEDPRVRTAIKQAEANYQNFDIKNTGDIAEQKARPLKTYNETIAGSLHHLPEGKTLTTGPSGQMMVTENAPFKEKMAAQVTGKPVDEGTHPIDIFNPSSASNTGGRPGDIKIDFDSIANANRKTGDGNPIYNAILGNQTPSISGQQPTPLSNNIRPNPLPAPMFGPGVNDELSANNEADRRAGSETVVRPNIRQQPLTGVIPQTFNRFVKPAIRGIRNNVIQPLQQAAGSAMSGANNTLTGLENYLWNDPEQQQLRSFDQPVTPEEIKAAQELKKRGLNPGGALTTPRF